MTSSAAIYEPFNSEIQYSALTSISLNTTGAIGVRPITPVVTAATGTISTTNTTVINQESSTVHENNNLPVRCKSLEIKPSEKSLTNSITKKRHRSTVDNGCSHSNTINPAINLTIHSSKSNLCLSHDGEQRNQEDFKTDKKRRKTAENTAVPSGPNSSDKMVYKPITKSVDYGSVYDYPKLKSGQHRHPHHQKQWQEQQPQQQMNVNENSEMSLYEQMGMTEAGTSVVHRNQIHLKQLSSSSSSSSSSVLSMRKNCTNDSQVNALHDATTVDTCNNNLEDEVDNELSSASELTTAAYNNFVRRVVDDTLDRTVTFCEQPKHAITALENICARAWPQLDVKRHRNRIRAYLKACRRNSKKNKGQINMKEPPANGLSIEARQLVSKALLLVADDLDYLKHTMQTEKTKNRPIFSTTMDSSVQKSIFTSGNTKRPPNQQPRNVGVLNTSNVSHTYDQKHDLPNLLENNDKLEFNKNLWNTPNNLINNMMNNTGFPFTDPLFWSNSLLQHTNIDSNCLTAAAAATLAAINPANILKLLPAALQLNNNNNNSMNPSPPSPPPPPPAYATSAYSNNDNHISNTNMVNNTNDASSNREGSQDKKRKGQQSTRKVSPHKLLDDGFIDNSLHNVDNGDNTGHSNMTSFYFNENKYSPMDRQFNTGLDTSEQSNLLNFDNSPFIGAISDGNNLTYCCPPPAHCSSMQYSPTINQALERLTHTGLLTHDDIEFFLQNSEVTKAAIKQLRCRIDLILEKMEIIENQIEYLSDSSKTMPLNLS
ncbi:unnamed protein product [Heterobilharzia americana]|nr:unnamed protein product [Heterobilharzia americana]